MSEIVRVTVKTYVSLVLTVCVLDILILFSNILNKKSVIFTETFEILMKLLV